MKIALYVPSWPPGYAANGIVTYASHLVPALRKLGHEVFVLSPHTPDVNTDPYAIDLRQYSSKPSLLDRIFGKINPEATHFKAASASIASAVVDLMHKKKIDVFEIEESFGWSLATSQLKAIPVVVRLHGPWALYGKFFERTPQIRIGREGEGLRHASYVTGNCVDTIQSVREFYGLDLKKNSIIPTPIDAPEAIVWEARNCDPNRVLFVGRFDKLKGAELVLKSFFELTKSNPKLQLTFVGPDSGIEGPDGKTSFFEQYVQKNFPDWFRSRIDFRGHMNRAELMSLRTNHFLTIIGAQIDTMGYMVLEPMSLGCPLVTTAVGGIPEFIRDGDNALLVPSQDVGAMVEACQTLLDDHAMATRVGRQAWLDCRNLYNSETVAMQSVSAYELAIEAFGSSK